MTHPIPTSTAGGHPPNPAQEEEGKPRAPQPRISAEQKHAEETLGAMGTALGTTVGAASAQAGLFFRSPGVQGLLPARRSRPFFRTFVRSGSLGLHTAIALEAVHVTLVVRRCHFESIACRFQSL